MLNQFVGNVDVSRPFAVSGFAGPLNVAFGAEYRRENYQIHAGEPDSYGDGGVPNQFGDRAAIGAQVFPGFRPSNEVDAVAQQRRRLRRRRRRRDRAGCGSASPAAPSTTATSAARSTASSPRACSRDPRFVVRGSVSTGFRAPSLGQSFFSSTATNFLNLGQGLVPVESLTLPVDSAAAQVLGAVPLKPENSLQRRAPAWSSRRCRRSSVTVDYYRIAIDDRIVLSGNFTAAADRRAARAVRRQQRAVLHQRDRHADQRRRRHGELPRRARRGGRRAAARRLQQHAHRDRRRRSRRRRSSPRSRRCCSIASSSGGSSAASRRTTCGSAATGARSRVRRRISTSRATASSAASR